jgi:hypothetical protein
MNDSINAPETINDEFPKTAKELAKSMTPEDINRLAELSMEYQTWAEGRYVELFPQSTLNIQEALTNGNKYQTRWYWRRLVKRGNLPDVIDAIGGEDFPSKDHARRAARRANFGIEIKDDE